jgi:hypothetical protein
VPRLALINSLATYQGHRRKWAYARTSAALIRLFGMRRAASIFAVGLFPEPWQKGMRDRATEEVACVPVDSYLGMSEALEQWTPTERLDRIESRTLIIAGEHDHTPIAEKCALIPRLPSSPLKAQGCLTT